MRAETQIKNTNKKKREKEEKGSSSSSSQSNASLKNTFDAFVCLSVCSCEQYKQKQQRRHHVITSSVNLERVPVQAIRLSCPPRTGSS